MKPLYFKRMSIYKQTTTLSREPKCVCVFILLNNFGRRRFILSETCLQMARSTRWMKPEVYPLVAAMTFVTSMCVFQLTRNMLMNPDVRINKSHRVTAVLENQEEGEKYAQHSLRKFLRQRPPEIMPAINHFFSDNNFGK